MDSRFRDPWSELDLLDELNLTRRSRTKYQKIREGSFR